MNVSHRCLLLVPGEKPGRRCSEAIGSGTQSPAVAADQKILASAPPAADISIEAGVPDRSTIANADRLRSDPMNLVGHARRRESIITASVTTSPSLPKTVIIGAGVVGLGIAWRLAQAGCAVSVYDRGEAGQRRQLGGRRDARRRGRDRARRGNAARADPRKPAAVAGFRPRTRSRLGHLGRLPRRRHDRRRA